MNKLLVYGLPVLIVIGLLYRLFLDWQRRWLDRMYRDYQVKFPGRCFVCSYHKHVPGAGQAPHHNCVEYGKKP